MNADERRRANDEGRTTMLVYLLAVGFISILGQVVILRELSVAFYGIELIYIISIGLWLTGTAIGASIGRRRLLAKEESIQMVFFFTAIILIADIVFIRDIRQLFQGVPGGYLPFFTQILAMTIALIPISFLMGILFQWTAKRYVQNEGTLAKAYSIESAGGIAGGLASTIFLYSGLQNFSIALLCSISALGVIVYYSRKNKPADARGTEAYYSEGKKSAATQDISARGSRGNRAAIYRYIYQGGLLVFLIIFTISPIIDMWMTSWSHPYLIRSKDTPYNRVTITKYENQLSVFEDGALSYETESFAAEEYVQLSTLHASRLDKVLVLGNGFGGVITELLKLPVKEIDYVEINRDLIETLERYLPEIQSSVLKDKKVNIIYEDPRQYLNEIYRGDNHSKELRSKELQTKDVNMYDAIIAGMPEPASAQSNRFYTIEFFRQCAKHMNEGSVLAFKISSSENLWTQQLQIRNKSIYNALSSAFSHVVVLPGSANIFIASKSALTIDPAALTARFNERKPKTKLVSPEYIKYIYTNDRFAEIDRMLSGRSSAITGGINSDLRPACYRYTLSIWLSKFFTGMSGPDEYLWKINNYINPFIFFPVLIILSGIIIFSRRLASLRRFILVALAGFIGMILETILILNYQSKSGILYRDIGILLMAFMAGLTLGSYLVNKLLSRTEFNNSSEIHNNSEIHNSNKFHIRKYYLFGVVLILGFAALNIIIYYLIKLDLTGSLYITSLSLIADGIFVAAIFAFASLNRSGKSQAAMIPLYSADLIGGCIGSAAASLIFIPVYGLLITSLLMASAAICTLMFIW